MRDRKFFGSSKHISFKEGKYIKHYLPPDRDKYSIISYKTIFKALNEIDNNKDSYISYDEFYQYVFSFFIFKIFNLYSELFKIRKKNPNIQEEGFIFKILEETSFKIQNIETSYEKNRRSYCSKFTFTIVALCLFAYSVYNLKSDDLDYLKSSIFVYNPDKKIEIWRFITYSFIHDG